MSDDDPIDPEEPTADVVEAMAQAVHYFSTACLHGIHTACRRTCKTCRAACRCDCHDETVGPDRHGDFEGRERTYQRAEARGRAEQGRRR